MQPRKRVKFSSSDESMAAGFSRNTDGAEEQKRSINDEDDNDEANLQAPTKTSDDPGLEEKLHDFFAKYNFAGHEKQVLLMELRGATTSEDYKRGSPEAKRVILSFVLGKLNFKVSEEAKEEVIRCLLEGAESPDSSAYSRRAKITDGLDIELAHTFDVKAFVERVEALFVWHDIQNEREEYRAPYFPLVQSSGMGKTRLFHEAKTYFNTLDDTVCWTILCADINLDKNIQQQYFDRKFRLDSAKSPDSPDYLDSLTGETWEAMERILEPLKGRNRIILLFDEAHSLMGHEKGVVFRTIRWWLRVSREQAVVAVFAGTNARLANFFPSDTPIVGVSRNAAVRYKNYLTKDNKGKGEEKKEQDKKKLYPPFFKLHTISCLRKRQPSNAASTTADPGFPHAALYGRPLFAHYYLKGELEDNLMTDFAKRLVLSPQADYKDELFSCYSVLGTRVQMGAVASFDMLSALVSGGYACLVDFKQQEEINSSPHAGVSFMSDPVCATLAMRFMDSDWRDNELVGRDKKFWTEQAEKAFKGRLCIPDKGNAGEVFATLYMLFCGDELRKKNSVSNGLGLYSNFVVSLDEWFSLLMNGGKEEERKHEEPRKGGGEVKGAHASRKGGGRVKTRHASKKENEEAVNKSKWRGCSSTVSFVQVCRNELRSFTFCEKATLEYLYQSGQANYTFKNCQAMDVYASIKVVKKEGDEETYHPLLVSVKNWTNVTESNVTLWFHSMESFLQELRKGEKETNPIQAVCLVILLGCANPPTIKKAELLRTDLNPFPASDVQRLVVLKSDAFGISDAIDRLGGESESCEIYSSHALMAHQNGNAADFMRSSASETTKKNVDDLRKALKLDQGNFSGVASLPRPGSELY